MKRFGIQAFIIIFFMGAISCAQGQVNLSSGLIAYFPFNGNASDASGNQHDGIVKQGTLTQDRFGHSNKAYSFDGSKKGITIPALGDYGAQGITISLWVKTSSKSAVTPVVQGTIGTFYVNLFKLGSFLAVFDGRFNNNTKTDVSSTDVASGAWVHLVATNDGSTTKIYVNGTLEKSYSETLVTGGSDFVIATKGFAGSIDDVRIYNRAVSSSEVSALYTATE